MPPPRETREAQAAREIGHTDCSRGMAVFLVALFLGVLLVVPLLQLLVPRAKREAWRGLIGSAPAMGRAWRDEPDALAGIMAANAELLRRIRKFGTELDDEALIARWARDPVQATLLGLGVGNEKAVVGRDGWLFYEPDLQSISGPGFLTPRQLARRQRAGDETKVPPQPDPMLGILHFRNQLRVRGIELVIMPVPVKPVIHPEAVCDRYATTDAPISNASMSELLRRLAAAGIAVYDCTDLLVTLKQQGPTYLKTDTHWRPEAMEAVAADLARFLRVHFADLPPSRPFPVPIAASVTHLGDIGIMLKLPADQRRYPLESVTVHPLRVADGTAWTPDRSAPILLLGDSFANIYSSPDMGWGEAAGLVEQVSRHLGLPLDRRVQNDAGAFATRLGLKVDCERQARQGVDRLAATRIVVWEFSSRELALGDWRLIELPAVPTDDDHGTPPRLMAVAGAVTGTVQAVSDGPDANAAYTEFVMKLHVTGLVDDAGQPYGDGTGVVEVLAMSGRKILPTAVIRPGDTIRLRLRPFEEVEDRYGSLKCSYLADDVLESVLPLYWGEPLAPAP